MQSTHASRGSLKHHAQNRIPLQILMNKRNARVIRRYHAMHTPLFRYICSRTINCLYRYMVIQRAARSVKWYEMLPPTPVKWMHMEMMTRERR